MTKSRWKPAILRAFAESDRLVEDLESGKVKRDDLIIRGELKTFDDFIETLHSSRS